MRSTWQRRGSLWWRRQCYCCHHECCRLWAVEGSLMGALGTSYMVSSGLPESWGEEF